MNKRELYINVLLKDNMIMCFHISPNKREEPHDYYKDFYYAGASMDNCDEEYEVKSMKVEVDNDISLKFNNYIFDVFAREYFKQWKIHPQHFGKAAYEEE